MQLVQQAVQLLPEQLATAGLSSTITVLDIRPINGYTLTAQMRNLTGLPPINVEAATPAYRCCLTRADRLSRSP